MNNLVKGITLDSREVAVMVEKRHSDLIRDIEVYQGYLDQNAKLRSDAFWHEGTYSAGTGKLYKNYQITRKGCEFIAHKLTGKKGAVFTATYINKFHELEQRIHNLPTIAQTPEPMQKLTYKGIPVITTRILTTFTNMRQGTIMLYARQYNICYELLKNETLQAFRVENNLTHYCASRTVVFTKEAVTLLFNRLNILSDKVKAKLNEYFALVPLTKSKEVVPYQGKILPVLTKKNSLVKLCANIPDEPKIISAVEGIRKRMNALDVMFGKYMMYHEEQDICGLQTALEQLACDVASDTMKLTKLKYQLVEKQW